MQAISDAPPSGGFDVAPYSSKDGDDVSRSSIGKKTRDDVSRCSIGKMTPDDEPRARGKLEQSVALG